ncbi:MAG: phosphoribosylamine--glycine ligase [Calditrichaeota bacterium]|nr:phosphoribosylamine--glycine ligase [Calditrichota bacterium]RQW07042.1 MAG: phosphoribosylamine--glycine ligase [Calditrichota bacterium]
MKILVLGSGGREHALIWKLKQSPMVERVYSIPGNAGIAEIADTKRISLSDKNLIAEFIREKKIDLTVVGPEQPLVEGLVDFLEKENMTVFGPGSDAARIEGSKVFAKNFMKKYNIPTADFTEFSDFDAALDYLNRLKSPEIVVKADGLAAGKGSIVCHTKNEAQQAIEDIMKRRIFGSAGDRIILEECMKGEEVSLFVIADGSHFVLLSPAQDFKRALNEDSGKNTGGMGSYAPTPFLTDDLLRMSVEKIVKPMLSGFRNEKITYKGVLYCGLMLTRTGPRVVEFNCRFGDPETQAVLPLLESDLAELLMAASTGNLADQKIILNPGYAVCVIAASGGYPDSYENGKIISGLDQLEDDVIVFHAGTVQKNGQLVTNGGRVLGVTAVHKDLQGAVDRVYHNIRRIHFEGIHYRQDIALRALRIMNE